MSASVLERPALTPTRLRAAFGAFPSGVTVVGAVVDGRPVGIAASSFTSVSLAPALVSVAFGNTSSSWPVLSGCPRFGISVLKEDQVELVSQMSRPAATRFDGVGWRVGDGGELLIDGAAATFAVRRHSEVVAGDHTVAFLEVMDVEHDRMSTPLVFHHSGLRRLAT